MRIRILQVEGGLSAVLEEQDDFTAFSVVLGAGVSARRGVTTLDGGVRFASDEQAWVEEAWLRAAGGFEDRTQAGKKLAGMLSYAESKGWIEPASRAIAAHVERT